MPQAIPARVVTARTGILMQVLRFFVREETIDTKNVGTTVFAIIEVEVRLICFFVSFSFEISNPAAAVNGRSSTLIIGKNENDAKILFAGSFENSVFT